MFFGQWVTADGFRAWSHYVNIAQRLSKWRKNEGREVR